MVQIDERVARCFSLLNAPEFEPLRKYLQAVQQETLDRLVAAQDVNQVLRLQGRSAELKEILELVEKGPTLLAKTQGRGRP